MKNRYLLAVLATVFLTGAAILVIEIAATRVLAPYFGNTIFSFSSVISTILAALSFGYYLGGRLADRRPSTFLFYSIIAGSGFTILLQHLLTLTVLPAIAFKLSMVNGPLISSLILFLLPAILLGTLSPFAIKLLHVHQPDKGVGHLAGLAFFWSTLGCIAGSIGAGFVLIPGWGTNAIVLGTGFCMIALGGVGMLASARRRQAVAITLILATALSVPVLLSVNAPRNEFEIYSRHGLYERIAVHEGYIDNRPMRMLMQDMTISSGMFVDDGAMAFNYTRYFDLYRLFTPKLENALAIGGGAYSIPKALLQETQARVEVAEVEPFLLPVAQEYFGMPAEHPRFFNHVVDGRRFLHDSPRRYDLIFSDVFGSVVTVPLQFTTREFFRLALDRLNDRGVFMANYIGSLSPETRPMLLSVMKTMQEVFPQVYVYATASPDSDRLQNFIFIGHKHDERLDLARAESLPFNHAELKDSAKREYRPAAQELAAATIFTDDHAPVEHYAARLVSMHSATLRR